ncbi:hypothetical protein K474DRAFT_1702455 [Panus rudis PR-1116 ss-1]|nr:hypothetical protein K474DRAFT_1702455 [Panus rudis PR-1116 ss-1]
MSFRITGEQASGWGDGEDVDPNASDGEDGSWSRLQTLGVNTSDLPGPQRVEFGYSSYLDPGLYQTGKGRPVEPRGGFPPGSKPDRRQDQHEFGPPGRFQCFLRAYQTRDQGKQGWGMGCITSVQKSPRAVRSILVAVALHRPTCSEMIWAEQRRELVRKPGVKRGKQTQSTGAGRSEALMVTLLAYVRHFRATAGWNDNDSRRSDDAKAVPHFRAAALAALPTRTMSKKI